MRYEFLKSFSKSSLADELIEHVLLPDLEKIKDVTNIDGLDKASNGEILVGKQIAAKVIQELIDDIQHYDEHQKKEKDPRDNMN